MDKELTGFEDEVIEYVCDKYLMVPGCPFERNSEFQKMLTYLHLYPTLRQAPRILDCSGYFMETLKIGIKWMAGVANEIQWEDRLHKWNHTPLLPTNVTCKFIYLQFQLINFLGIVDTFPVEVQNPHDSFMSKVLYHGKYGTTVFKFQNVVDFLGRIVCFTGAHLGKTPDHKIWESTSDVHPLKPQELVLADGAYISESQVLCPFRQPPNGHLTFREYSFNQILGHYRSRVEHSNAKLKKHKILGGIFRGKEMDVISCAALVIANCQNVHQHMHLSYEPYGPHSHF
jgi:hypothetical protein